STAAFPPSRNPEATADGAAPARPVEAARMARLHARHHAERQRPALGRQQGTVPLARRAARRCRVPAGDQVPGARPRREGSRSETFLVVSLRVEVELLALDLLQAHDIGALRGEPAE